MYQNQWRPKVMSDYFGLIRIDRVFRFVNYEDGEEVPTNFHDIAKYENGYNSSEVGHVYWRTVLSGYGKMPFEYKRTFSYVIQNSKIYGWCNTKMSSIGNGIIQDTMSEYGDFR